MWIIGSWIITSCIMNYYNPVKKKTQLFKRKNKNFWNHFSKVHSQVWDNFWQIKAFIKNSKNAFPFTSKTLFVLKIFKFCLDFLVMQQNGLKKALIRKFWSYFWIFTQLILLLHHFFISPHFWLIYFLSQWYSNTL